MKSKYLPFEIVYEDSDLIVIDKPAGLLTTHTHLPSRMARESQMTAENLLTNYVRKGQTRSSKRVWLVHRLDRETSGVMMFVKSERLAEAIREKWNELTEKTYLARVEGILSDDHGVFESWLREDADGYRVRSVPWGQTPMVPWGQTPIKGAKFARTEWKRLSSDGKTTLVEVALKSGRKNQIRVHFSEAGHPVVGDVKYGAKKADGLHLRSIRLVFTHPFTHRCQTFAVDGVLCLVGDASSSPVHSIERR